MQRFNEIQNPAAVALSRTSTSRNVLRTFSIFELIKSRGEPLGVPEISAHLGIPRSTTYDLIRTLIQADYLEKFADAKCGLGRKLYELGAAYKGQSPLLHHGGEVVRALRDEIRETVQLSVLDNGLMFVVLKEEGLQPVRIISNVGTRVPCNWAAAGKVLLAHLGAEEAQQIMSGTVRPSPTGKAITDIEKLSSILARTRRAGYGIEVGEVNAHSGCVAAPVFDVTGNCVAALSIAVPEQRLEGRDRDTLIVAVRSAAGVLSKRIAQLF